MGLVTVILPVGECLHITIPVLINVDKTLILGSPRKQNGHPVECITRLYAYISANSGTSALMKAYL